MKISILMAVVSLLILAVGVYVLVLLIRALRKYIRSEPVRKEKAASARSLGEVLKRRRTECKMTQEFVAEALGVKCYDSELINETAKASGFAESWPETRRFWSSAALRYSSARRPQSSSSRTPSWNFSQEKILTSPISPVRVTCVPQQAQMSTPGNVTMRTSPVSSFLLR